MVGRNLKALWHGLLCLVGRHDWEEEQRWVGPAMIIGVIGVVCPDNAQQGIDVCRRCGARQKYLLTAEGQKHFAELIHDERE